MEAETPVRRSYGFGKLWNSLLVAKRCRTRGVEWFSSLFEAHALFVYDHPWKFILIPAVILSICSIGMLFRTSEYDMEKLYTLPDTPSMRAKNLLMETFESERLTYIAFVADDGEHIFRKQTFNSMWQVIDRVLNLKVPTRLVKASQTAGDTTVGKWLLRESGYDLEYHEDWDAVSHYKELQRMDSMRLKERDSDWYAQYQKRRDDKARAAANSAKSTRTTTTTSNVDFATSTVANVGIAAEGLGEPIAVPVVELDDAGSAEEMLAKLPPPPIAENQLTRRSLQISGSETASGSAPRAFGLRPVMARDSRLDTDADSVEELRISRKKSRRERYVTLDAICTREAEGGCKMTTIHDAYTNPGLWGVPIRSKDYPNYINARARKFLRLDALVGEPVLNVTGEVTAVVDARAALVTLHLNGDPEYREKSATWEAAVIALIREMKVPGLKMYVRAERSVNDELANASVLDIYDWIRLTLATIFVFIQTVGMNASYDRYKNKMGAAALGVICTLLAYGGGCGFLYAMGVPHVPPAEATPFITLGIGVDDVFVIGNAYSLTSLHKSARKRMGLALRDSGVSITITTATNIFAFIVGASCKYMSITVFCVLTAVSLTVVYFLCLTMYVGALALSAKAEERMSWRAIFDTTLEDIPPDTRPESRSMFAIKGSDSSKSYVNEVPQQQTVIARSLLTKRRKEQDHVEEDDALSNFNVVARRVHVFLRRRNFLKRGGIKVKPVDADANSQTTLSPTQENLTASLSFLARGGTEVLRRTSFVTAYESRFGETPREIGTGRSLLPAGRGATAAEKSAPSPVAPGNLLQLPGVTKAGDSNDTSTTGDSEDERRGGNHDTPHFDATSTTAPYVGYRQLPSELNALEEPSGTVGKQSRRYIMEFYGPFITHPVTKVAVLFVFLAVLAINLYGCFKVHVGMQLADVTPGVSYLRDFYDVRRRNFDSYGEECVVFFPDEESWWDPRVQRAILELGEKLEQERFTVFAANGMRNFLLDNAVALAATNNTREEFTVLLKDWLKTVQGLPLRSQFRFEDGQLVAFKYPLWISFSEDTLDLFSYKQGIQQALDVYAERGYFEGYVSTPLAIMWESDPIVLKSTILNMSFALLGMLLTASVMIPDWSCATLIILVIIMIDIDVFGSMYFWNLNLDMLTMVDLVISIGFAIDYTAHITHCFTHCRGRSRDSRVIEALVLMGVPILNGAISTAAAVVVLSTSDKYVLLATFKMFVSVLGYALLHGVIFMPVVLSLIGPFKQVNSESFFTTETGKQGSVNKGRQKGSITVRDPFEETSADGISLPSLVQ